MGRRSRRAQRERTPEAPTVEYAAPDGSTLVLRTVLTVGTRREYAAARAASPLSREDAWQRSVEFLFERLAVAWAIAGVEPLTRPRELLGRFRLASPTERAWVRDVLRRHLTEHFPDLEAP